MSEYLDVTPTPRILRTLGDIPFEVWQCFAELVDNSLDAFQQAGERDNPMPDARVKVSWSSTVVGSAHREIVVEDNGPGMTIEQLSNAVRAGYTGNDPIHNLGLFGMGFNIATARLGDETTVLSTVAGESEWTGVRLSFPDLIRTGKFDAPIIKKPKEDDAAHGTKIVVRYLRDGVFEALSNSSTAARIRRRLETVYTPVIESRHVVLEVGGKALRPSPHCVWDSSRFVIRKNEKVPAVIEIDENLGEAWFDTERNRYLTEDEIAEVEAQLRDGNELGPNLTKRPRRLHGWLGIQRYADTSDFGVDFTRNGRKILVSDKRLFGYENPDTGVWINEYPVELGSTVGGRIVGVLHVDYLIPTYQKNGFDYTDTAWRQTVDRIRGAGPILPRQRSAQGYSGDNTSPLGRLVNAFRRTDAGTKHLAVTKAQASDLLSKFRAQTPGYVTDIKWFAAAQDNDRERGTQDTPVNSGDTPSDDVDEYSPSEDDETKSQTAGNTTTEPIGGQTGAQALPQTSTRDELKDNSVPDQALSGHFQYGLAPGFDVDSYRLTKDIIRQNGHRVPFRLVQDGVRVQFYYDPRDPILAEYPITPRQLLLQALSERFAIRDQGVSSMSIYFGLVANYLQDERVNSEALREMAQGIFTEIADRLPTVIGDKISTAFAILHKSSAEHEHLASSLLEQAPSLFAEYQKHRDTVPEVLRFLPVESICRLVPEIPSCFTDGKVFDFPYESISLSNDDLNAKLKQETVERMSSYLRDLATLLRASARTFQKAELFRYSNTVALLRSHLT